MKKIIPIIYPISLILLPIALVIGSAALGKSSPVQNSIPEEIDFLNASENNVEILFFGYAGCQYICPNSLFAIAEVLETIEEEGVDSRIGAYFLDVNAKSQVQRAHEYSQFFSKKIKGVNISEDKLNSLRKDFGLVTFENNRLENHIVHSDHFFVLKKEEANWRIVYVLPNQSSIETIKRTILNTI